MLRYIIGFFVAVGLIIVVLVLIFHGSNTPVTQPLNLDNDANTAIEVQFTIDNPISSPQTHNDIIITVSNSQSSILITKGYDGQITNMQTYPMSVTGYADFLRALNINGFTLGINDPAVADERGHCALGDRFIYQVLGGNGNNLERYWSTSCNTGTFKGNIPVIQQLFELQIPNYGTLTSNITL